MYYQNHLMCAFVNLACSIREMDDWRRFVKMAALDIQVFDFLNDY